MPRITYIESNGASHTVEVRAGRSVMEGALTHSIPGIVAACGGNMVCGTCHVYVDPAWLDVAGQPSSAERGLLAGVFGSKEYSRLSCQIKVTAASEGLVVRLPEFQG